MRARGRLRSASDARGANGEDQAGGGCNWYFARVYGVSEGPSILPFYYDPARVGGVAVDSDQASRGPVRTPRFSNCSSACRCSRPVET